MGISASRAIYVTITFALLSYGHDLSAMNWKNWCPIGFGKVTGRAPGEAPVVADKPADPSGESSVKEAPSLEFPFSPTQDTLLVTINPEGEIAMQTIAALREGGTFNPVLTFPPSGDASFSIGRPFKKTGAPPAIGIKDLPAGYAERPKVTGGPGLIDVKDLPEDYAEQRRQQVAPNVKKPTPRADPMASLSRGQLTWRRSLDGYSILLYNGVFDAKGEFVPAMNPIQVATNPRKWNEATKIPPTKGGPATPEANSIELLPRKEPYHLLLPNGATLVVEVAPQKAGAPVLPVKEMVAQPPPDPAPFLKRLQTVLGPSLKEGELITLRSKPRLPDHPNGSHYVGTYKGVVVQDGKVYVALTEPGGRTTLHLADRLDLAEAKLGLDPKLVAPGPGNLLARPKPAPIVPDVKRFDPNRNLDYQLTDYIGSAAHPKLGATYWHDYAEKQTGVKLGGNREGAREIEMPDGTTAIAKTYMVDTNWEDAAKQVEAIVSGIRRMETWASEGRGPRVLGMGYKVEGKPPVIRLTVVMENMLPRKQLATDLTVVGAQGRFISARARALPEPAREWLRDMLLLASSPTNHPDGHLLNVGYRITHLRSDADLPRHGNYFRVGNQVVEVYAVDSVGALADQTMAAGEYLARYDPARKREYLNEALGLGK